MLTLYRIAFLADTKSYISLRVAWQATAHNWNKSLTHIARHVRVPDDRQVWWTKSQSSLLNIYFRFRSSFILVHFRFGPNTCSHYTKVWYRAYPICDSQLAKSAWRSIAPLQKTRRNRLSYVRAEALYIWYEFRAGVKAILYSANIAIIRCTSVTTFTIISVFDLLDFMPINGPLAFSGFVLLDSI